MNDWRSPQELINRRIKARLEDKESPISLDELATAIGVGSSTLRNWLYLRTRFDSAFLLPLAQQLDEPVETLAVDLGLLSEDYALAGQRMVELTKENQELKRQMYELVRDSEVLGSAIGRIAQLVGSNEEQRPHKPLAAQILISLKPWFEGLDSYRVWAGEFLLLERADGHALHANDLDTDISRVLHDVGATAFTIAGTWPTEWRERHGSALLYIVPRLNIARPADHAPLISQPRSIAIISTHTASWTTHVVSLVGRWLGYGSTTTILLTRLAFGDHVLHGLTGGARPLRITRPSDIARRLFADPLPDLIWGHDQFNGLSPALDAIRNNPRDTLVVYLRPSDRLHAHIAERPSQTRQTIAGLAQARHEMDKALENSSAPHLIVNVGFPTTCAPDSVLDTTLRDWLMLRSMAVARRILLDLRTIDSRSCGPDTPPAFRAFVNDLSDTGQVGARLRTLTEGFDVTS